MCTGPGTGEGRGSELSPRPISHVCPSTPVLTPRAHLFQVDPDIEARATIEKRDLQCLQVVGDVLVSCLQPGAVSGQVHLVNPFCMGRGRMLSRVLWQGSAKGSLGTWASWQLLSPRPICILFELMPSIHNNSPPTYGFAGDIGLLNEPAGVFCLILHS